MPEIIPPAGDPTPPAPQPDPHAPKKRTIVCECCDSQLDRNGGLLRRGQLAKDMIESEDTIRELRKQLKTAQDTIAERDTTISELRAAIPSKTRSRFSLGADA